MAKFYQEGKEVSVDDVVRQMESQIEDVRKHDSMGYVPLPIRFTLKPEQEGGDDNG